MENIQQRDPYFEKFINLTVDFIVSEVKERLKDFKPVDEEEKLSYVPKEAAKILGVGNNTIYNLLKEDDFPSFKINDKWYVSRKGLEDWVEKQTKK